MRKTLGDVLSQFVERQPGIGMLAIVLPPRIQKSTLIRTRGSLV
jgi:hypothetical protein